MGKSRAHPKRNKYCVFCNYWMGNANLAFINSNAGYEFDSSVNAKCAKMNNNRISNYNAGGCIGYEPSIEARKLL